MAKNWLHNYWNSWNLDQLLCYVSVNNIIIAHSNGHLEFRFHSLGKLRTEYRIFSVVMDESEIFISYQWLRKFFSNPSFSLVSFHAIFCRGVTYFQSINSPWNHSIYIGGQEFTDLSVRVLTSFFPKKAILHSDSWSIELQVFELNIRLLVLVGSKIKYMGVSVFSEVIAKKKR